jgi:tetratricopeptide (TPR) repeat protein
MNKLFSAIVTLMTLAIFTCLQASATNREAIQLNNDGVSAINAGNFEQAITALERALRLEPAYEKARYNLAIAHNNYGLYFSNQGKAKEALKHMSMAAKLNPDNQTTHSNIAAIIKYMKKDPNSFQDRVDLGNDALEAGDYVGAIYEYEAALAIKKDKTTSDILYSLKKEHPSIYTSH